MFPGFKGCVTVVGKGIEWVARVVPNILKDALEVTGYNHIWRNFMVWWGFQIRIREILQNAIVLRVK